MDVSAEILSTILNMHLIKYSNRYLILSKMQIKNPLLEMRSKWRIAAMLALVWSVPMLYVSLPYLGWHDTDWKTRNRLHKCVGNRLVGYRVLGLLIIFYIPVSVLIVFYYFIYQVCLVAQ